VRAQTSSAASGAVRLHVKPQPPDGQRQSETEDVLFSELRFASVFQSVDVNLSMLKA
jgi:hypothetical protein